MAGALSLLAGALLPPPRQQKALNSVSDRGWYRILESVTGAWQQNLVVDQQSVLANHAVFACTTLIASDIAKLRLKLVEEDAGGIWTELENPAFSPVLRKPNDFQNRIQFYENWMLSKLLRGNTYVLKERDGREVVKALYVLDPNRVKVLVSDSGDVFYELSSDNLAGLTQTTITVPAREIIHDRFNCIFHPLIGISPIFANGLAATQGLRIQENAAVFFGNRNMPGGVLTAPDHIKKEIADELKARWQTLFTGENVGKVAVLGDGMKFEPIAMTSVDAQMIEQLKWTAEIICSTYHVPPYKIGVGTMPTYNNIQALNVEYYNQSLQRHIEDIELCLDEGLGLGRRSNNRMGTEFDLDGLLRMDSVTQMNVLKEGVGGMILAPDEARKKLDLKPVEGGASPLAQQQNYSLAALAKRDAQADPFAPATAPAPEPTEDDQPDAEEEDQDGDDAGDEAEERAFAAFILDASREPRERDARP